MKKFSVSKACNACGECIVRTDLLLEDAGGFAVPVAGKYISDSDLPEAEKTVSLCPMQALSIVDTNVNKGDLHTLPQKLRQQLSAVEIQRVSRDDIRYKSDYYERSMGYDPDENFAEFSSYRAAKNAAEDRFDDIFWNQRQDYAMSILARYTSTKLRPFYDFEGCEENYFTKISKQFEDILKEMSAEAEALTNGKIQLPKDFTHFRPEAEWEFQSLFEVVDLKNIGSASYVEGVLEGMEKDPDTKRKEYLDYICISEDVKVIGKNWLGDKTKSICRYKDINKAGNRLAHHIAHVLGVNRHMRAIDDIAQDGINSLIKEYKELAKKAIEQKVQEFEAAIKNVKM